MDPSHPRADGPQRRRAFSAADKLAHLTAYEQACESSDAGVLDGKKPGNKIGKLTTEQAEIARLKRELERANKRLATTEPALEIMGRAHSPLEQL
ncbi:hypothetical protein MPY17_32565 [Rhodococcus opacus]|uniref:hypothetical protein n=1 Tax=Rhodococcus opacus TaxID=37919 RepID=UPI001FF1ABC4|nr:hypothetical protein [Rhodococcus opacus]UOT03614.1 hypothetical protein MPY17_32565 [Rhodococcus opacus]